MFDFLAASNTREDVLLFGPSIRRDDEPDVLTDCFAGCIPKYSFSRRIPGCNYAIESFADDDVI
jgi:hypothetical protein